MNTIQKIVYGLGQTLRSPGNARQLVYAFPKLVIRSVFSGGSLFLISRLSGKGDIIATLPSVGTLKTLNPNAIIIYETHRDNVTLVEHYRHVDLVIEKGSLISMLLRKVLQPKRKFFSSLPDERQPPEPRGQTHIVEEFKKNFGLEFLIEQNSQLEPAPFALKQVKQRLQDEGLSGTQLVVIHTGPTWKVKEWPSEKWSELCTKLQSPDKVSVIQIGENQTAYGEKRESPAVRGARDWRGRLTLDQTLALLSVTHLFVGIDSGVLHMAGAVNTPCVGIFGPTMPSCFLPRTPQAVGVTSNVPCLGCHHLPEGPLHWQTGCPFNIRCMKELSAETVYIECQRLLSASKN